MGWDDVDLSHLARLRGYRCVYVPDAVIHHAGSRTLQRNSPAAVYFGQRNLEWTYLKNTPWILLIKSLPSHVLYDGAALLTYGALGLLRPLLKREMGSAKGYSYGPAETIGRAERPPHFIQRSLAGDGQELDSPKEP